MTSRFPAHSLFWPTLAALVIGAALTPKDSFGENDRRQVVEANVVMTFAEHLGRSPLVSAGAGLELGAGQHVGLVFGGFALIASESALPFFEETAVGGGLDLGLRFHIRSNWPRGFAVGLAASVGVVDGVALVTPRAELTYRFVLLSHLSIRIIAAGGGMFIWDTQPGDNRRGPASREGYVDDSLSGVSISIGLAIGWSGAQDRRSIDEEFDD
jgi:hypothetical protein